MSAFCGRKTREAWEVDRGQSSVVKVMYIHIDSLILSIIPLRWYITLVRYGMELFPRILCGFNGELCMFYNNICIAMVAASVLSGWGLTKMPGAV